MHTLKFSEQLVLSVITKVEPSSMVRTKIRDTNPKDHAKASPCIRNCGIRKRFRLN